MRHPIVSRSGSSSMCKGWMVEVEGACMYRRDVLRRCRGIIDCKACQHHSTCKMQLREPQGAIGIEGMFGKRVSSFQSKGKSFEMLFS